MTITSRKRRGSPSLPALRRQAGSLGLSDDRPAASLSSPGIGHRLTSQARRVNSGRQCLAFLSSFDVAAATSRPGASAIRKRRAWAGTGSCRKTVTGSVTSILSLAGLSTPPCRGRPYRAAGASVSPHFAAVSQETTPAARPALLHSSAAHRSVLLVEAEHGSGGFACGSRNS